MEDKSVECYIDADEVKKRLGNISDTSLWRLEKLGLPCYDLSGKKYKWSEVEEWTKKRKRMNRG